MIAISQVMNQEYYRSKSQHQFQVANDKVLKYKQSTTYDIYNNTAWNAKKFERHIVTSISSPYSGYQFYLIVVTE